MKRPLLLLVLALILLSPVLAAKASPYSSPIKQLYSAPDENSNLIYNIPVTVKLLDVSDDANWHKVEISYSLGPLSYTYQGWTQIPIGSILAEREKQAASKVAAVK